jgi:hypothetical protein
MLWLTHAFLLKDAAAYRYPGDKNCTSSMIASNVGGHLFLDQCSNDIAYLGRFQQYMVRFHFSEFLKSVLESCAFYTCDLLHDNSETQHSEQENSRTCTYRYDYNKHPIHVLICYQWQAVMQTVTIENLKKKRSVTLFFSDVRKLLSVIS